LQLLAERVERHRNQNKPTTLPPFKQNYII